MENITESQYQAAKSRVDSIKKFYRGALVFIIVFCAVSLFRFYKTGDFLPATRISLIFVIWGIILTVKAVKLFLLNTGWENDMLKKELKKQQNGNI